MEKTFTIYPRDLTPECYERLNRELVTTSGEGIPNTNWDEFGCALIVLTDGE